MRLASFVEKKLVTATMFSGMVNYSTSDKIIISTLILGIEYFLISK